MLTARAPAKINLTLHVTGRREDGWHSLESLVAFTRFGDIVRLVPETLPGALPSLEMTGPTAASTGAPADNLVLKAVGNLMARVEGLKTGAFHLTKNLPVAAGIGGGSSDAAAALRLVAKLNGLALDDPRLLEAAAATGADVPVCLVPKARMMQGVGEKLGAVLDLPPLFAVLVNPGIALETAHVFARMGLARGQKSPFGPHPAIPWRTDWASLLTLLARARNDMEDAAQVLVPVIGDVQAVLRAARGCRLVRMSGSGATCFALFDNRHAASRAARVIRRAHSGWWVRACVLS